jgi:hypothetical protein
MFGLLSKLWLIETIVVSMETWVSTLKLKEAELGPYKTLLGPKT